MEKLYLSRKQLDEIKKNKEEEDRLRYEKYVGELDELYFDLHSEEFGQFYDYFLDILEKKFYCVERDYQNYKDFVDFVNRNSNHREIFKESKIESYLDDVSSEEEEDEEKYEFLMKKTERF